MVLEDGLKLISICCRYKSTCRSDPRTQLRACRLAQNAHMALGVRSSQIIASYYEGPRHDTVVDLFIYLFRGGGGNWPICLKFEIAANKNNTSTTVLFFLGGVESKNNDSSRIFFLSGKRPPCPSLSVDLPLKVPIFRDCVHHLIFF